MRIHQSILIYGLVSVSRETIEGGSLYSDTEKKQACVSMGVSLERVQFKFASIIGELCSEPEVLSQFAVWLDLRLAEYKLKGAISLDCSGEEPDPVWLKGLNKHKLTALNRQTDNRTERHSLAATRASSSQHRPSPQISVSDIPISHPHTMPSMDLAERLSPDVVVVKEEPGDVYPVSIHRHESRKRPASETVSSDLYTGQGTHNISSSPSHLSKQRRVSTTDSPSNQSLMSVIGGYHSEVEESDSFKGDNSVVHADNSERTSQLSSEALPELTLSSVQSLADIPCLELQDGPTCSTACTDVNPSGSGNEHTEDIDDNSTCFSLTNVAEINTNAMVIASGDVSSWMKTRSVCNRSPLKVELSEQELMKVQTKVRKWKEENNNTSTLLELQKMNSSLLSICSTLTSLKEDRSVSNLCKPMCTVSVSSQSLDSFSVDDSSSANNLPSNTLGLQSENEVQINLPPPQPSSVITTSGPAPSSTINSESGIFTVANWSVLPSITQDIPNEGFDDQFLNKEQINDILIRSKGSRTAFVSRLTTAVFLLPEVCGRNVNGLQNKKKLDPRKVDFVKRITFAFYPAPAGSQEIVWQRECVKAMDRTNRQRMRLSNRSL